MRQELSLRHLAARTMTRRLPRRFMQSLPQSLSARYDYLRHFGTLPNIAQPRTFNDYVFRQKMDPASLRFAPYADKVLVKDHVRSVLGPEWVIPTLWAGKDIRRFPYAAEVGPIVVKANHGQGMNHFVRKPEDYDLVELESLTRRWLERSWPRMFNENWYNEIDRQILVEPLLPSESGDLMDYKIFVFAGEPVMIQIDLDRFQGHKRAMYSPDWQKLHFCMNKLRAPGEFARPRHLDAMLDAAAKLGADFDFARVDFYDMPEHPLFGEITFSPARGIMAFDPPEANAELGSLLAEKLARRRGARTA